MDDLLKPSMLDSIDVDPPKASTDEAAAYCATVISNLEGWKGRPLPWAKDSRRATIDQLDTRLRRLEHLTGTNPPPPIDTPSWDSLVWRVARLHRKMPLSVAMNKLYATPPHITPTLDLLRSTVISLGGAGPHSWGVFVQKEESLEEDELIRTAAQFLCYIAGRRHYKITGSFELKQNCILALDLSLDADANPALYIGPASPVVMPRPGQCVGAMPGVGVTPLRKACCGCCACSCHNNTRETKVITSSNSKVLTWMTGKPHKEKRNRRTGVKARIARAFRKLAFWKRNRGQDTDSDVSSITTRSSSTFA